MVSVTVAGESTLTLAEMLCALSRVYAIIFQNQVCPLITAENSQQKISGGLQSRREND